LNCQRILEEFNITEANPVQIPAGLQHLLYGEKQISNQASKIPYREVVGSLLYLNQITKTDITFSVNLVCRYAEEQEEHHWTPVKQLLKYFKGLINYGFLFSSSEKLRLKRYIDADYVGDMNTKKSISGTVFTLGSGAIA